MSQYMLDRAMANALNRLGREQTKMHILNDILIDLTICEIEGWDKTKYIRELRDLIDDIERKIGIPT